MNTIVSGGDFFDYDLGQVKIYVRHNSKHISSSWKDNTLCINVPKGTPRDLFQKLFVEQIKPDALAMKPKNADVIDSELLHIDITTSSSVKYGEVQADYIGIFDNKVTYKILVNPKININAPTVRQSITVLVNKIKRRVVHMMVVAEAWDIARRLGLQGRISNIRATTAQSRYGSCSARGVISLSHMLATCPYRERVETITHELAHLTYMDHSPAFHALHQQYLRQILPPSPTNDVIIST